MNIFLIFSIIITSMIFLSVIKEKFPNNHVNNFIKKYNKLIILIGNKYYYYILGAALIVGFIVRIWEFGVVPYGFNQDGAMGSYDALSIAKYGTDRFGIFMPVHFTAWEYSQMSVLSSYLLVPFIKLFGLSPFIARLPQLLASLLGIIVLYLLCKEIFNKKIALFILIFCAINPWHIMQSRWILDCNMFPHFLLFSMYLFVVGIKYKRIFLYCSMAFFALTMYAYGIAWFTIPIFVAIILLISLIRKNISIKEFFIMDLVYLFFAWPILAVMFINYKKIPSIVTPLFTIPFFPHSSRAGDLVIFSDNISKQFFSNLESTYDVVIKQNAYNLFNAIPEYGHMYLFSMPFVLMGLACLIILYIKKSKLDSNGIASPYLVLQIFLWIFISILTGLMINGVNISRINIAYYPMIILAGLGIYYIIKKYKILLIPIALMYIISFSGFTYNYFTVTSDGLSQAYYRGFDEATNYLKEEFRNKVDRVYVTNWTQFEDSRHVSEILFLFHYQVDPLYFQGKQDEYTTNNKKLQPYIERYQYKKFDNTNINSNENAAYIVNNQELSLFDESKFDIEYFYNYSLVTPKNLNTLE